MSEFPAAMMALGRQWERQDGKPNLVPPGLDVRVAAVGKPGDREGVKRGAKISLLALGALSLLAGTLGLCAWLSPAARVEHLAEQDFAARFPECQLASAVVGEGDGSAAYVHVCYTCPGEDAERKEEWQYMRGSGGAWESR